MKQLSVMGFNFPRMTVTWSSFYSKKIFDEKTNKRKPQSNTIKPVDIELKNKK